MLTFSVECRETKPGEAVYIVGSVPELGSWCIAQGTAFFEAVVRNALLIATHMDSHGWREVGLCWLHNILVILVQACDALRRLICFRYGRRRKWR